MPWSGCTPDTRQPAAKEEAADAWAAHTAVAAVAASARTAAAAAASADVVAVEAEAATVQDDSDDIDGMEQIIEQLRGLGLTEGSSVLDELSKKVDEAKARRAAAKPLWAQGRDLRGKITRMQQQITKLRERAEAAKERAKANMEEAEALDQKVIEAAGEVGILQKQLAEVARGVLLGCLRSCRSCPRGCSTSQIGSTSSGSVRRSWRSWCRRLRRRPTTWRGRQQQPQARQQQQQRLPGSQQDSDSRSSSKVQQPLLRRPRTRTCLSWASRRWWMPWAVCCLTMLMLGIRMQQEPERRPPSRRRRSCCTSWQPDRCMGPRGGLGRASPRRRGRVGSRAEDSYQLTVETYNSTSWASLKQRLAGSEAHVVLAQEVHLLGIDIEYASQWARVRGWKSIIEEAIPGRAQPFSSGGVAIFARDWLGLSPWPVLAEHRQQGRLVAGTLEAPGYGEVMLVSAYRISGQNLDEPNSRILEKLGAILGNRGCPFVVAGDFQVNPGALGSTSFLEQAGAKLVCATDGSGTCRGAYGRSSVIDYFIIEQSLAGAVQGVRTCIEEIFNPHRPVELTFFPKAARLKALGFEKPVSIPCEIPFGPRPRQEQWSEVRRIANFALHAAGHAPIREARECLDRAYESWATTAERGLVRFTGSEAGEVGSGKPCEVSVRS